MTETQPTPSAPVGAAATMRAVVQHAYGETEVLDTVTLPLPAVRPGAVRVRVEAVSPDAGTVHLMRGRPLMIRAVLGRRRPRQPIIGLAFAGVVESIGEGVRDLAVSDRVAGTAPAAMAEYVVARADRVARIPNGVTMAQAATLPVSGGTALQALRAAGELRPGARVLVIGAGGGVGSFLTQLAVARGARVTGLASASKAAFVRSLGAERVIDHRAVREPADWGRYDVVIDTADGRALHVLRRALTPRGTLVIVGADHVGGPVLEGFDRQLRALLLNPWVRHRVTSVAQRENAADIAALLAEVAAGRLAPAVDEVAPLAEVVPAMQRLAARTVRGKLVVALR
ncbi:NAD(P)-dependent alcohol dehydrogenase [Microcella daejeonensis]|uniref:NAD(P)-dependent alcohol dehydrogenase n=1 Tax=Microcella daejeonensis TaxID=2994971 RepID=A0A9E8S8E1_9MICO|nr:NAD(P)-dependent alcohol dehydrogenase [Microcella daejeonensis]WAB80824.1 NAD(P)-dependent alcohol dehydrogenase [Microcella daejeonensis]